MSKKVFPNQIKYYIMTLLAKYCQNIIFFIYICTSIKYLDEGIGRDRFYAAPKVKKQKLSGKRTDI